MPHMPTLTIAPVKRVPPQAGLPHGWPDGDKAQIDGELIHRQLRKLLSYVDAIVGEELLKLNAVLCDLDGCTLDDWCRILLLFLALQ